MPNTPRRSFRASDALWSAAQARAAREGDELSTILVRALLDYARDDDAPAPDYPSTREADVYQDAPGAESVTEAVRAIPTWGKVELPTDIGPDILAVATARIFEAPDYPSTREAYQDAPGADEPCLCAAFPARHARSDHTKG